MGRYEKTIAELREATGYELGKEGSVDDLIAYKDVLEDRLASLLDESGDHLDFVHVVEVFEREDGIYVFSKRSDADRFTSAVRDGRQLPDDESASFTDETPINVGDAAERLIASERADVLEGMGCDEELAEAIRDGADPSEVTHHHPAVLSLLQRWAEEDAKGGQS